MKTVKESIEELLTLYNSPLPSKNHLEYWLSHITHGDWYPKHTDLGGKWVIFCEKENIDSAWELVKELQDKQLLGSMSKTSTAIGCTLHEGSYAICVYTYDSSDMEDVMRVRENLRKAGFTDLLKYKRDIETKKRIYNTEDEFMLIG